MPTHGDLPQLIRANLQFVYACALRQTRGDVHLAEDITQAVFIILARKPPRLREDAILRDWLFVTTRFAAKNAMKMEARRRYHERHAAAQRPDYSSENESILQQLSPLLDDAIAKLNSADRAGVLLSFFDNKTFREVGTAMGVSEDAARKRVHRAIDKMRSYFAQNGIIATSAGVSVAMQSQTSAAISHHLLNAVTGAALAANSGTSAGGSSLAIVKGVNQMIAIAKLKFAACLAICVVALGGSATVVATAWADRNPPATQPVQQIVGKNDVGVAKFDDGVIVAVVGVSKNEANAKWWRADGSPADAACDPSTSNDSPVLSHAMCLQVSGVPEDAGIEWIMPPNTWSSQPAVKDGAPLDHAEIMAFNPNQPTIDVTCNVACGAWEMLAENNGAENSRCGTDGNGSYAIAPAGEQDGKALVSVSFNIPGHQVRVVGVDSRGEEHPGQCIFSGATTHFAMLTIRFDFPLVDLAKVVLQKRPYDHLVEIKNVTLDPAKKTKVEIIARKQ